MKTATRRLRMMAVPMGLLMMALSTYSTRALPAETGENTASDQTAVRAQFLSRLKTIADTADLFDLTSTSAALGIDLDITAATESVPQPPNCATDGIRSQRTTQAVANALSWYRVLPSGAGHMAVPAAFINPASATGDAKFSYKITRDIRCVDRIGLQDRTRAEILFNGLPSFSCVSFKDIKQFLPGAEFRMATDGVAFYNYHGRQNDDVGTDIEFLFRLGAPCALYATITQD